MKRVFLLCSLLGLLHNFVKAQKVYFVYLQSENATPFYVRIGGEIKSSSTEGYLILSNLRDSTYQISIGQPGKQAEPRFSMIINKADRGFLIRSVDGTINLFDLQTLSIYKPVKSEATSTGSIIRTDNFTRLLALVADDSTLLTEPLVVVAKEQKLSPKELKPDVAVVRETVAPKEIVVNDPTPNTTAAPVPDKVSELGQETPSDLDSLQKKSIQTARAETVEKLNTTLVEKPVAKDTALSVGVAPIISAEAEVYKKSVVIKKSESSTSEGFGLVFLDQFNGGVDTVQLVIPNPSFVMRDITQKQASDNKKFLDMPALSDTNAVLQNQDSQKSNLKVQCAALATDDDFFKLRRDMTAKNNDDEMISQAKRYFKAKCYRTEQIRYLTALFLTEESKYQFFDAAYMHVSDQEKFKSLEGELKDNYYINRFKALIAN